MGRAYRRHCCNNQKALALISSEGRGFERFPALFFWTHSPQKKNSDNNLIFNTIALITYTFQYKITPKIYTFQYNFHSQIYTFQYNFHSQIYSFQYKITLKIYTFQYILERKRYTFQYNSFSNILSICPT